MTLNDPESLSLLEIFDGYSLPDTEVMLFFQPDYKFKFSCFQILLLSIGGCSVLC